MAREMFGDVSNPSGKLGSRAWYTVPLSIAAHVLAVGTLVVVPMLAADLLPSPPSVLAFVAPAPMPAPPPPPPASGAPRPSEAPPAENPDAAPIRAADEIAPEIPRGAPAAEGVPGGLPDVGVAGSADGVVGGLPTESMAPPLSQEPLRPGGDIRIPAKVHHVPPVYPTLAQQARIEGVVILEATIGTDGRVTNVRVLKSKPLLERAAIDAVMRWRFTPTLLNGVPVPILMTVTVNFTLDR